MLCEIGENYGYFAVWVTLSLLGALATITLSSVVFIPYYAHPTYEKWTRKCNPKYPSPALVRKEIIQSLKGVAIGVLCPAFALYSSSKGLSYGYCGDPNNIGIVGHFFQTLIIIGFSDFTEYGYHWSFLSYSFPLSHILCLI
jgi:sterol desaturase/sphingolipid hydroxylase (fatty acid hydroxylase superfamily)